MISSNRDIKQFKIARLSILESALTLGLTEVVEYCESFQTILDDLLSHQITTEAEIRMESAIVGLEKVFAVADAYFKEWYHVR